MTQGDSMHMKTKFQCVDGLMTQIKNSEMNYAIYVGIIFYPIKKNKTESFILCILYGNLVHFDQKWTHSPAKPLWLGLVGIKIALFDAGMQTCGEIWPGLRDTSSPVLLYIYKAANATVTLGLSHPGLCFHDTSTTNYSRGVLVKWSAVD